MLAVEYRANFLAPAQGSGWLRGEVTNLGRTLTVRAGEVFAHERGKERFVAMMLTMMTIQDRANVTD